HGPALRRGGTNRRPAPAPWRGTDLRAGDLRRPPAVFRHEAGQGAHPVPVARGPQGRRRQPASLPVDLRGDYQQDVGWDGTDAAYAIAFRAAELDLDALEPAELARRLRLRREAVAIELSAFLDDWSAVRRGAGRPLDAWRKPLEAARLA